MTNPKEALEWYERKRVEARAMADRDCNNCKHHKADGCSRWECEYEPAWNSMGVYVKGMEMPKNCTDCGFCYDMCYCAQTEKRMDFATMDYKRMDDCPLIEVSEALTQDSRKATQDLISREDAIKCIRWGEGVTDVIGRIKALPSADAVEVVRCKDCKYAHMTYIGECKYCDMWKEDGEALYLDGDFFCAYGERREP